MTYPVFVYNILLIAGYVLIAAVFFYLFKTRRSALALWCALFFGFAFVDNSIFFMKEIFYEIGHTNTILTDTHWICEMGFQSFFALILRYVIGYYLDDKPGRIEVVFLSIACALVAYVSIIAGYGNIAFSALPGLPYVWVFLRGVFKTSSRWIKIILLMLLALYAFDGFLRVFGGLDMVSWGHRNFIIEGYWTIYFMLGIYIASALLNTVEETYTPDENAVFQQFLDHYGVSIREGDIAKLLMEGATNQDISNQLFLALGTVKAHNYHIYKKLGIKHRTQVLIKYTEYLEDRAKRK